MLKLKHLLRRSAINHRARERHTAFAVAAIACALIPATARAGGQDSRVTRVPSKDGTLIHPGFAHLFE